MDSITTISTNITSHLTCTIPSNDNFNIWRNVGASKVENGEVSEASLDIRPRDQNHISFRYGENGSLDQQLLIVMERIFPSFQFGISSYFTYLNKAETYSEVNRTQELIRIEQVGDIDHYGLYFNHEEGSRERKLAKATLIYLMTENLTLPVSEDPKTSNKHKTLKEAFQVDSK